VKTATAIPTEFRIESHDKEPVTVTLVFGDDPPIITIRDDYGNTLDVDAANAKALAESMLTLLNGIPDQSNT
jgi:hypothetical protein